MHVDKILSVLSRERGLCNGVLMTKEGETEKQIGCAIGALLFHAGMHPREIEALDNGLEHPHQDGFDNEEEWLEIPEVKALQLLKKEYDLDYEEAQIIMGINDQAEIDEDNDHGFLPANVYNRRRKLAVIEEIRARFGACKLTHR